MLTFITEDNHESLKEKGIIKNVVDDKLKYEDYKNFLFNKSYMRYEMNRIKGNIIIQDCIELIEFLCLLLMIRNTYLKMDVVDYHIFINLLVNDIKNYFRRILTICFNFCSSQNSYSFQVFFPRCKKLNFLCSRI